MAKLYFLILELVDRNRERNERLTNIQSQKKE